MQGDQAVWGVGTGESSGCFLCTLALPSPAPGCWLSEKSHLATKLIHGLSSPRSLSHSLVNNCSLQAPLTGFWG